MKNICGTLVGFAGITMLLDLSNAYGFRLISFDGKAARWDKESVSYTVGIQGSKNFRNGCDGSGKCESEVEAIRKSFETWTRAANVTIQFEEKQTKDTGKTGYDKENSIVWVEKGWTSQSFTPPSSALAVTVSTYKSSNNEILDSDIHFNGEYFDWAVIDTPQEEYADVIDIQNIATHEIGHFIGLDHSSEDIYEPVSEYYVATMFFASGPGETFRRDLKQDDISAAQNLYPAHDCDEPHVDSLYPNQVDASVNSLANVTIKGEHFLSTTSVVIARSDDNADIGGRIISITGDSMQVEFDLFGLADGEYDMVVSNSYKNSDRIKNSFAVFGSPYLPGSDYNRGLASSSQGGCNIASYHQGKPNIAPFFLLFLLPLLLISWTKYQLSDNRLKRLIVKLRSVITFTHH